MPEPKTLEAYEKRFQNNMRLSGEGITGVTQHFPCPFCAASDWLVVKVIEFQQDHLATCRECGREGQLQFDREPSGAMGMRMLQTGGEDPPAWLEPPPPRGVAR